MAKVKKMLNCLGEASTITSCSGIKSEDNFYASLSKTRRSGSKVPYCKDCCAKMIEYYLANGTSMRTAVYFVCQKIDIPFIAEIYDKIEEETRNKKTVSLLGAYVSRLKLNTSMKEIWTDFTATNVNIADIDSRIEQREVTKKELQQFTLAWGANRPVEDYMILENTFDKLNEEKPCVSISQEGLYRDLCYVELQIMRNKDRNEDIKNESQQKMALLKALGFDKFETDVKTEEEKTYEANIKRIEETRPCESEIKEEYKDILGLDSMWIKHIMRSLKNTIAGMKEFPSVTRDGVGD